MSREIVFEPAAQREFEEATVWYETQKSSRIGIVSVFHSARNPEELKRRLR